MSQKSCGVALLRPPPQPDRVPAGTRQRLPEDQQRRGMVTADVQLVGQPEQLLLIPAVHRLAHRVRVRQAGHLPQPLPHPGFDLRPVIQGGEQLLLDRRLLDAPGQLRHLAVLQVQAALAKLLPVAGRRPGHVQLALDDQRLLLTDGVQGGRKVPVRLGLPHAPAQVVQVGAAQVLFRPGQRFPGLVE